MKPMLLICSFLFTSCKPEQITHLNKHNYIPSSNTNLSSSNISHQEPVNSNNFDIRFGATSLQASADGQQVTILNYPSEWLAKMYLVRFDGDSSISSPFSKKHCEEVRTIAKNGGGAFVRGSYHSSLMFDIPPFVSADFYFEVVKSAQEVGIHLPSMTIKNPINVMNAYAKVELSSNAISSFTSYAAPLEEILNLSRNGHEKTQFRKNIILAWGDLICDLIAGDAKLMMIYPVTGENREIRVLYEPMQVTP